MIDEGIKQYVIDISRELGLAHIGSNLSVISILQEIYIKKNSQDIVILDNAHAHLAHLLCMSNDTYKDQFGETTNRNMDFKHLIEKYGIHCDRQAGCDATGGSLGHGIGIGIGYALVNRLRNVYVVVSDGSMMEGSNWEALRIKGDLMLGNLKIWCNLNSYTAVAQIDRDTLVRRMKAFCEDIEVRYTNNGEGFEGIEGHYKVI